MKTSESEIVKLVNSFADFQSQKGNEQCSISDFCMYYLTKKEVIKEHTSNNFEMDLDSQLAAMLSTMSRYANHYTKKAMREIGFNNSEDWLYLVSLLNREAIRKTDLIHEHVSEFPTGIEVINRLLRSAYIEEFIDETDKRSKKVAITELGKQTLYASFPHLQKIGPMAFSKVNQVEKIILLKLLKRLEVFHNKNYKEVKDKNLEEAYNLLME